MKRLLINAVEGICGNNCVWCYKEKLEPQPFLSFEAVASFFHNNHDWDDVLFMGLGETLDHPDFLRIVRLIDSYNISLPQFNTSLLPIQRYLDPDMIEGLLLFKTLNIEIGGLTKESKASNMGRDAMWSFHSNLRNLYMRAKGTKVHINVKMIVNKNNYQDFSDHLAKWKKEFPDINFFTQSLHVFDEDYFRFLAKSSDPKKDREEFIRANFDVHFPFIDSNCTKMEYDADRHTFCGAWFIGVDGQLYTCQNMAQLRWEEYRLGHISEVKIDEVIQTEKFKLIACMMKNCCATPLCSKYCPM